MTTTSHTPGPWTLETHGGGHGHLKAEPFGYIAAVQSHPCLDEAEREANARLIAAAPDLLAALKELVALMDRSELVPEDAEAVMATADATNRAEFAIAKAEGR